MSDPINTFSILANVALAIAGFSGIVIALGGRSRGTLKPLESRRLFNLFTFSALVLVLSLACIALLHIQNMNKSVLWRTGSAIIVTTGIPWMVYDWRVIGNLDPHARSQISGYVIYPFTVLAIAGIVLQVLNVFYICQLWPLLVALVLQLTFALQQFVLLVYTGLRST